ncbi:hypothetical protein [Mycolicibacterium sphagni]|uniref:Uncharacterized protein n=1 Tax=Mycolicibacterium sphagni TaxID=1786 RepID=A0ABX2K0B3_9MYCO|nr:hypothetical protein [Mycolicibacterium sphagni]NTY62577.1 hypothetical protein [Mycolicibacterium sphagni]
MTALMTTVTDETVFHYVRPLRGDEHGDLLSIWSGHDILFLSRSTPGWALIDAQNQVWGWHRREPEWSTASAALDGFIADPIMRERLVADGFRVLADHGPLLEDFIRGNPSYGLPPLASGPTGRPAEPILPNWGHLLDLAQHAVRGGDPHASTPVEDLILAGRDFHRPAVFKPAVMRRWLASDDAPAALSAMRAAAGRSDSPRTTAEAFALLEPLGCNRSPGDGHTLDAHLSDASTDGDWLIGTCGRCWHPIVEHERPDLTVSTWSLFGDLR